MATRISFPVKYFEDNLIFSEDGAVWTGYRMDDRHYDYRSETDKLALLSKLESFYWNTKSDTHALMVPRFQRGDEPFKVFNIKTLPAEGAQYLEDCLNLLKKREVSHYQYYMFVRLTEVQEVSGSPLSSLKYAVKDFKRFLTDRSGTSTPEIFEEEIEACRLQEELVFNRIRECLNGKRITTEEIQWLIRRGFYRGIGEVPLRVGWKPGVDEVVVNEKKAKRPRQPEVLSLTEGKFKDIEGRHLEVEQFVDGKPRKGFMAFMTISYFPDYRDFPGAEWLLWLNQLPFGVEGSIRTEYLNYHEALGKVRNKKKELDAEEEHAYESGVRPARQLSESQDDTEDLERDLSKDKFPLLKMSVVLCVSAPNEQILQQRIQAVQDLYVREMFEVQIPYGDQWRGFNEFIPGGQRYIIDYIRNVEPVTVAASMIGFSRQLGDGEGCYIGDLGHQPVFFLHDRGPRHPILSTTASALFVGKTGKGKSLLAKLIVYLALMVLRAKGVVFDPKDEWRKVLKVLPELRPIARIVTLRSIEEDRGKLDPLSGASQEGLVESGETAKRILQFLARTPDGTFESTVIGKAVDQVVLESCEGKHPASMMKVLDYLKQRMEKAPERRQERLEEIYEVLMYHASSGQTQLLFGDGTQQPIDLSKQLTVLQVEGLQLPKDGETDFGRIGLAVMMAISDFSRRFSNQPSNQFKFVLFDEAWRLAKAKEGRDILEELIRTGRSKNSAIYIASQSASKDLMGEEIKNNIGYKFVFGAENEKEAEESCRLLGIEVNDDNIKTINNLPPGICLMSDLEGRVNELQVNPVQQRLLKAFDTRPGSDDKPQPVSNGERRKEAAMA
ncbi:ATP-binding protein [Desmospora activa]|uniref:AAA domain-containing protein n=1 Tax=Desmospora activa DSM 45169 TaxID=1121389 RepID=A0A2T4YZ18_9BACL|nr:ATP-binding protein [Desmospora activa]PTM52182.1 AAA domain-containing protein [Desmospora activa DSM 45169]